MEKSPLWGLQHVSRLTFLLKVTRKEISAALKAPSYRTFLFEKDGKKARDVEEPMNRLKSIHRRLLNLLKRIETSSYLISGRKGLSYIDNAKFHAEAKFAMTVDLRAFYRSCSAESVFRLFRYRFGTSEDVAWMIVDLVCYKGYLPTGSPVSQLIAYWTCSSMFDEINAAASKMGFKFSLYVDDLSFSSPALIPRSFLQVVKQIVRKHGHQLSLKKTRFFHPGSNKVITGCVISPRGKILIPNRLQQKISIAASNLGTLNAKKTKQLLGRIGVARQIEPGRFPILFPAVKQRLKVLALPGKAPSGWRGNLSHVSAGCPTQ